MQSLNDLQAQLSEARAELAKITVKKHGTVPWAPGVQDQFNSRSYSYDEYTDVSKANRLKSRIASLEEQISTYAQRAREEREREEALRESRKPKYEYTAGGKAQTSPNPAMAARYNAQQRFFGMNKLKQTVVTLSGQKRKFKRLWIQANTQNEKTQEQVAFELNKLFR